MTEAEKRVIEAARYVVELWRKKWLGESGHGDSRRALIDTVDALRIERAAPASPPPAPAVDVAGLEEAVRVAKEKVITAERALAARYAVFNQGGSNPIYLDEWGDLQDAGLALVQAEYRLAAARKPKGLLTIDEAMNTYHSIYASHGYSGKTALSAVLSAAHERFVAAVEAGLEARGYTHDCVARTEFREVCAELGRSA